MAGDLNKVWAHAMAFGQAVRARQLREEARRFDAAARAFEKALAALDAIEPGLADQARDALWRLDAVLPEGANDRVPARSNGEARHVE
jgi:hypothetical protein